MLYLVPTPIGNLGDISARAVEVLSSVDLILAEDTRHTAKLLAHLGIKTPTKSFHSHNEHKILNSVIDKLKEGVNMALVSDAGTPGISDPGFLLTRELIKEDLEMTALPGATALIPALLLSGFSCERFVFEGFLPHKKGRQTRLKALVEEPRTIVLYESTHRLLKTLSQMVEFFGPSRRATVSREITKMYEETRRGTVAELLSSFEAQPGKGEFVICVEGWDKKMPSPSDSA